MIHIVQAETVARNTYMFQDKTAQAFTNENQTANRLLPLSIVYPLIEHGADLFVAIIVKEPI